MSHEVDTQSMEEVQKTLKILRQNNREVSTNNRIIREQIRLLEIRTENVKKDFDEQKAEMDSLHIKEIKQMETEEKEKTSERKLNKKKILNEIKEKTEENTKLENQIRLLNQEIVHYKKMRIELPKPKSKLSTKQNEKLDIKKATQTKKVTVTHKKVKH